jgi:hypothetical protein
MAITKKSYRPELSFRYPDSRLVVVDWATRARRRDATGARTGEFQRGAFMEEQSRLAERIAAMIIAAQTQWKGRRSQRSEGMDRSMVRTVPAPATTATIGRRPAHAVRNISLTEFLS